MILGKLSEPVHEDFSVTDVNDALVPNIDSTAFTYHIFDDNGDEVSATAPVSIIDLGYGHYRATFTPDSIGMWMLAIYNASYFPWGKTGNIQIFASDFDSMVSLIKRILGLVQENYYIDQTIYDESNNMTSGRIRIYDDGSPVGGNTGIIATYTITADYDTNTCKMISYKVEKI